MSSQSDRPLAGRDLDQEIDRLVDVFVDVRAQIDLERILTRTYARMGLHEDEAGAQRVRDLAERYPKYQDDLIHALYLEGVARRATHETNDLSWTEGSLWAAAQLRHGFNQPDVWPELQLPVDPATARKIGLEESHRPGQAS